MPPKSKKSKTKKAGNNSQSKLKYINSCVKTMVDEMPRQTFSHMVPVFFDARDTYSHVRTADAGQEPINSHGTPTTDSSLPKYPKSKKRKNKTQEVVLPTDDNLSSQLPHPPLSISVLSSHHPVVLTSCLWNEIPRHPNIAILCAFCHKNVPSMQMDQCMDQPHSRRRFTPMCDQCNLIS